MVVRAGMIESLTPPDYRQPVPRLLEGFVPPGFEGEADDEPITSGKTIQDVTYEAATVGGRPVDGLRPYVVSNGYDLILGLEIESWTRLP
jgi:hypothetical protein